MKILVVEDQPIFRRGLVKIVKSFRGVKQCDEAANGVEAIEKYKVDKHDIIFMDINMELMDGIEATRILKKESPEVRIIILSMYDSVIQVMELLELEISAYLMKDAGEKEVLKALTLVSEGSLYFAPQISWIWNQYIKEKAWEQSYSPDVELTGTEKKVITLICEAVPTKDIAEKLHVALSTVNNHKQNIMKKLNIHSTAALVMYAVRSHIIKP